MTGLYKRINWVDLKRRFFKSEVLSVQEFLRIEGMRNTGNTFDKTVGWGKDKERFIVKQEKKLNKKIISEYAESEARRTVKERTKYRLLF
ncbi:hypothetical protein A2892_04260 [Candidatus Woesebacteria bacterium RIFCSPLOWO2_01_FULL_39_10b]|uniref:Uncharacterized protein n=1 Tax=Candidatus Woesebacteria bacterium RIFCSPLOWO2_01_FULL_39_10b TaxID=1802517 RepID=A0A1F8BA39_9BACT|nr:MAG: hypothetical protein A2892_04260 [Candidatus Woesebacteria bacterium RIFCSPLOWO2_01_FULL_39_10b]